MQTNRFLLNEKDQVIDGAAPPGPAVGWHAPQQPKNESELRECVLGQRLNELVDFLITAPSSVAEIDEQTRHQRDLLRWMLYRIIKASSLNTLDVRRSLEYRFGGQLKARETGYSISHPYPCSWMILSE